MDLDEIIYSGFLKFLKKRQAKRKATPNTQVVLQDIRTRLKIISSALCGQTIDIYDAEREGGYKGEVFFLPATCSIFSTTELNFKFYLFRTIYLATQKQLQLNWLDEVKRPDEQSRQKALIAAEHILPALFAELPKAQDLHSELHGAYSSKNGDHQPDWSWLYGKWMNDPHSNSIVAGLKEISDTNQASAAAETEPSTTIKAKATENIEIIQVDKKAQEDYVLTHNFEKVETAEEFSGS